MAAKIKPNIEIVRKNGLNYIAVDGNRARRFKPWLGDSFSFLYDRIMKNSIFPKKFGGDIQKHEQIMTQTLTGTRGKRVLELAAGSGSAVRFLECDNAYTGIDISPGLLRQASRRFREAGFSDLEFYVSGADDLPFKMEQFDLCLCVLSLNFFGDTEQVLREVRRVLTQAGAFVCCVPVPERNRLNSTIRGVLHTEAELEAICRACGLGFEALPDANGALLYFRAARQT